MKMYALGVDENNRSVPAFVDIALHPISETESLSAKQAGTNWRIGFRTATPIPRTSKAYASDAGPYEMHLGGMPHFVGVMSGCSEITTQDGAVWRFSAGEFHYVAPGALHHSNYASAATPIAINLGLPGTPADIKPVAFK